MILTIFKHSILRSSSLVKGDDPQCFSIHVNSETPWIVTIDEDVIRFDNLHYLINCSDENRMIMMTEYAIRKAENLILFFFDFFNILITV